MSLSEVWIAEFLKIGKQISEEYSFLQTFTITERISFIFIEYLELSGVCVLV